MKKEKSQLIDVLTYLLTHDSLTSIEAFEKWRITRLADVVYKLRKRGFEVSTELKHGENAYGTYSYAVYRMGKEQA